MRLIHSNRDTTHYGNLFSNVGREPIYFGQHTTTAIVYRLIVVVNPHTIEPK